VQAPLTYRGAPLPGAEAFLIGTTDHSVLGQRWVYDACGDPVYVNVLTTVIRTGGRQAEEFVDVNGELVPRATPMVVAGNGADASAPTVAIARVDEGDPTVIVTDGPALSIPRVLNGTAAAARAPSPSPAPGPDRPPRSSSPTAHDLDGHRGSKIGRNRNTTIPGGPVFGEIVRSHRRRLGMSQEDLAEKVGVSVRTIGKIESGRTRAPRPFTVGCWPTRSGCPAPNATGSARAARTARSRPRPPRARCRPSCRPARPASSAATTS
jgi:hypothetical protein